MLDIIISDTKTIFICFSSLSFIRYVRSLLLDYDFNKLEDIWFTSASNFTMATMELLLELPELLSIGKIFKLFYFLCNVSFHRAHIREIHIM